MKKLLVIVLGLVIAFPVYATIGLKPSYPVNDFLIGNTTNLINSTTTPFFPHFNFGTATGTSATTSSFAISGISSGNCLHTTTGGAIVGTGSDCGSGGGSQTPWAQDINGGGFSLSNVLGITNTRSTTTQATSTNFFATTFNAITASTTNLTVANTITGSISGNAGTATKLATGHTISVSGDLTYTSPSFDGSGDVTAAGTLATVNITNGSFGSANSIPHFTVNGKGLITTAGANTPSIPASEITTGTFGTGDYVFPAKVTATNASSTLFSTSYASSTQYFGAGLVACNSASNAVTWSAGVFGCNTISAGSSASSTLLGDNNTFSGNDTFTNAITGSVTGNAGTATKLATARTIAITGDLAYTSPSFDGSGNVTAAGTLATVNSNVGSFTNANITVNGKGLVTAAANGTDNTASSTLLGDNNAFTGLDTFTDLKLVTRSTTTQATTTNLFATTASTTNLFVATGSGCLQADATGKVASTGSNCGTSSGGITSITAGTGLTGGTITTTGTIALDLTAQNIFTGASTTFVGGVTLGTATATSATTTNLAISSVASKLLVTNGNGTVSGYGGASACSSNNFVTALSALGATTCGTSTISGVSLGGTLGALTATDSTLTFSGSYTGATARTIGLNLANANTWTALQTFSNANSLLATGSSTLQNFTFVNATGTQATTSSFAISGISSGNCLHTTTGGAIVGTGSDCGSGSATSPGGATGNIQLNDFGVFGGHSYLTLSTTSANAKLTIGAPVTAQDIGQLALSYSGSVNDSTLTIQPANGTSGAKTLTLPNLTDTLAVIGTNNSFTAQQSFTNANSLLASGSTTLQNFTGVNSTTTNATTTTIDISGEAVGTDVVNSYTGRLSPTRSFVLSTGTTTTWTASTTGSAYSPFLIMPFAGTVQDVRCSTDSSFLGVNTQVNGSNATPSYFVASTTVGKIVFSSGNTFTAGQKVLANFGTTTTSSTLGASCTYDVTETP